MYPEMLQDQLKLAAPASLCRVGAPASPHVAGLRLPLQTIARALLLPFLGLWSLPRSQYAELLPMGQICSSCFGERRFFTHSIDESSLGVAVTLQGLGWSKQLVNPASLSLRWSAPCSDHGFVQRPALVSATEPVQFSPLICGTTPALPFCTILSANFFLFRFLQH